LVGRRRNGYMMLEALAGITQQQGASAFLPSDLPGLVLWLDASDSGTITATGSVVDTWTDKSANAASYGTLTGLGRPETGTRTINGLNALDFDGSQALSAPSILLVDATDGTCTTLAVALTDTIAGGTGGIFSQDPGGGGTRGQQYLRRTGSALETVRIVGSVVTDAAGTAIVVSTAFVASQVLTASGARVEAFIDGASNGASAGSGANTTAANIPRVGVASTTAQRWDGLIGEIVQYDRALSDTDRQTVETYLATKWGTP
jgi:hypothetical protein